MPAPGDSLETKTVMEIIIVKVWGPDIKKIHPNEYLITSPRCASWKTEDYRIMGK